MKRKNFLRALFALTFAGKVAAEVAKSPYKAPITDSNFASASTSPCGTVWETSASGYVRKKGISGITG